MIRTSEAPKEKLPHFNLSIRGYAAVNWTVRFAPTLVSLASNPQPGGPRLCVYGSLFLFRGDSVTRLHIGE
jgi:hypothetical protein